MTTTRQCARVITTILVFFSAFLITESSPVTLRDPASKKRAILTVPLSGSAAPIFQKPYNATYPLTDPVTGSDGSVEFRLAIISDQDTKSKRGEGKESKFISFLKMGTFTIKRDWSSAAIVWDTDKQNSAITSDNKQAEHIGAGRPMTSQFAFGNRGMELSDIVVFNGKLYACEDRTGIIFQIIDNNVVPWVILADGNGAKHKGFKCEWSLVKDEHLYVGSHSADIKFPHADGPSVDAGQRWVKKISKEGLVEHVDWNPMFASIEKHLGITPPGYIMHEAALWSELRKSWYFMPRQINSENYTEEHHPYTCSNIMVVTDENFTQFKNYTIGEANPMFGFSAARFVPGTDDTVIIALRILEVGETFSTRITVFSITGTVLLVEEEVLDGMKYEGIEFV